MNDWNESDFRLFVGNLGREVTTEILTNQFRQRYPSFTKARVVENKMYKGSQGYGFVAFSDPLEGIKAMKEMNGRLCGSRPMKVMKSEWQKKDVKNISLAELIWVYLIKRSETREERETGCKDNRKSTYFVSLVRYRGCLFYIEKGGARGFRVIHLEKCYNRLYFFSQTSTSRSYRISKSVVNKWSNVG